MARSDQAQSLSELATFGGAIAAATLMVAGENDELRLARIKLPESCAFRRVTGHRCPMCGMTRGFAHLTRGRVGSAVRANPVSPLVFGYFMWRAMAAAGKLALSPVGDSRSHSSSHAPTWSRSKEPIGI